MTPENRNEPDAERPGTGRAVAVRSRLRRLASGEFADLPNRIRLTIQHEGLGTFLFRILTFPLRFTPLGRRLPHRGRFGRLTRRAIDWYGRHGEPVTVVIPTYGPPDLARQAVRSVRKTTDRKLTRVVLCDDGSAPEHVAELRRIRGAELVEGSEQRGFAANCNRGLRESTGDVVLLNSDVICHGGWLQALQYAAHQRDDTGIVGPKLLYEDGTIQSAGTIRNPGAPEWFDHRFRGRPSDLGPANVPYRALTMTGACLYIRRDVIERIGLLEESYGMAYEDVDYCLRAWEAGFETLYFPAAELTHLESKTRGMVQGERELESQRRFWGRWGDWFERRAVRTPDGRLRVVYVTEDTGVGGGHRDIFEHVNRLRERGHDAQLWSLGGQPDWFDLDAEVRSFRRYEDLVQALTPEKAIKIATWWNTGPNVWKASVVNGIPVFFVQDFETSYYPDNPIIQREVVTGYREEFRYMTISSWNRDRLRELGLDATLVPPGIDLETFRPLDRDGGASSLPGPAGEGLRRRDVVLAIGRTNPLKNLPLTIEGWRAMPEPRPALWMFGIEPELGPIHGVRYFDTPSDEEVNGLFNTAGAFVQTSRHEGFCLPPLEAMAAGTPVVCTDAHGNRDFCRHEENCLLVPEDPAAVAEGLHRVLNDEELRARLVEEGIRTAADYAWERRIDQLEAFLEQVASGTPAPAVPLERA